MSENKRSDSHRLTTHDRNDPAVLELRERIKWTNKQHKQMGISTRMRVLLRGRVPADGSKYDWCGNSEGGLNNATRYDVYVYERYTPCIPRLQITFDAYEYERYTRA